MIIGLSDCLISDLKSINLLIRQIKVQTMGEEEFVGS
jgi:hypothetical protein